MKKKRPRDPDDLIEWFEHLVNFETSSGEEFIQLHMRATVAIELLERLKKSKRPRRGRKAISARQRAHEGMHVQRARWLKKALLADENDDTVSENYERKAAEIRRKEKLVGQKLTAATAGELAAKAVSLQSRLSPTQIEYWMNRPGRRSSGRKSQK